MQPLAAVSWEGSASVELHVAGPCMSRRQLGFGGTTANRVGHGCVQDAGFCARRAALST